MRQFKSLAREQYNQHRGLTLVELLIAICIFSLIVIGFSSIDTFSQYHVITSDRRAKLQNDASYVLGNMAKNIGRAIGDVNQAPVDTNSGISGDAAIKVWIDSNPNGKRDNSDSKIAYRHRTTGSQSEKYQFWYYSSCVGPNCNQAGTSSPEVISRKISNFSSSYSSGNDYIEIQLTTCWDPDGSPAACGSPDNPALSMKNRIYMPAVSTH